MGKKHCIRPGPPGYPSPYPLSLCKYNNNQGNVSNDLVFTHESSRAVVYDYSMNTVSKIERRQRHQSLSCSTPNCSTQPSQPSLVVHHSSPAGARHVPSYKRPGVPGRSALPPQLDPSLQIWIYYFFMFNAYAVNLIWISINTLT